MLFQDLLMFPWKARTAALFRKDSADIGARAQHERSIFTLEATNEGLISFGGGVVVWNKKKKVIGAVGVSGASVEQDQAIALTGANRQSEPREQNSYFMNTLQLA